MISWSHQRQAIPNKLPKQQQQRKAMRLSSQNKVLEPTTNDMFNHEMLNFIA